MRRGAADTDGVSLPYTDHGRGRPVVLILSGRSWEGQQWALIEAGPHGLNATHPDQFNAALLGFVNRL